jgi:tetratricopeptide (TPR) repeat protein
LDDADLVLIETEELFSRHAAEQRTRRMGRANALNERGIIANERGFLAAENGDPAGARSHHLQAHRHLLEARQLYDMAEDPDLIGRANSAKNLGVAFAGLDQTEHADHWLELSRREYAAIGDALGEVEVLNFRGRLLRDRGRRDEAARYFKAALATLRRGGVVSALEEAKAYAGLSSCSPAGARAHRRRARLSYAAIGLNEDNG